MLRKNNFSLARAIAIFFAIMFLILAGCGGGSGGDDTKTATGDGVDVINKYPATAAEARDAYVGSIMSLESESANYGLEDAVWNEDHTYCDYGITLSSGGYDVYVSYAILSYKNVQTGSSDYVFDDVTYTATVDYEGVQSFSQDFRIGYMSWSLPKAWVCPNARGHSVLAIKNFDIDPAEMSDESLMELAKELDSGNWDYLSYEEDVGSIGVYFFVDGVEASAQVGRKVEGVSLVDGNSRYMVILGDPEYTETGAYLYWWKLDLKTAEMTYLGNDKFRPYLDEFKNIEW